MKRYSFLLVLIVMLAAPGVYADQGVVVGKITRTLVSGNGMWGGCMVMLDASVQAVLPGCPAGAWVTFSCTGDFTTKDAANRMFDSGMMAKAMDKRVVVFVDDAKKHHGYCHAWRIDVL